MDIAQYLVDEKGADVNAATNRGSTPLHLAARNGHSEIVKYFVDKGADLTVKNTDGRTPKDLATEKGYTDIVRFLEKSQQDRLIDAAKQGDLNMVKKLIDQGTNFKFTNESGFTPLHYAASRGHLEVVQYLVDKGADINCATYIDFVGGLVSGRTPLHWAARSGRLEVVKYLVAKGADINCRDTHDSTPLDLAVMKRGNPVTLFLKEQGAKFRSDDLRCSIQLCQKQQRGFLDLSQFISNNFQNASIQPVKQGLYLPSFEARNVKIDGKCVAITRGLSQVLFLHSNKSFLSDLGTSSEIYERIAQGKQVSKREEREVFAFSKLLNNFERQLDSATNSLPSNLIHTQDYKTLSDLSNYITEVNGDFAIHLVTSNHAVAIYRTSNNYACFDSNTAFVSGLKSVDQLMQVVGKAVESAGYKVEEKGFLVEHFDVDKANSQLSNEDKQILAKEIKTERQLLAKQDKELGPIKSMVNRVQLYDFGTKINVEGSVPLLINAEMSLSSRKFQDHLDKKEVSMTAREYLDNLKNSKNVEEVVQATKLIPFIGSNREIEEAEQTRKPLLEQLVKGTINYILAAVSLTSASRLKSQLPEKADDKPRTCLNDPTVDKQLQRSVS